MTKRSIFVVSDSTGATAEKVVRAALLQFPGEQARIHLHTRVRDRAAVEDLLIKASEKNAMAVFTLVAPDLRAYFHELALEYKVEAVDVIGTLIHKVANFFETDPLNQPTATMPLSEEYFRRVEAIEFAVKSDDGREPQNLRKADLVLTGVSRTSKTPLSTFLAGRGLRVANVPLIQGVEPPPELFEMQSSKVVALSISIDQLLQIRRQRLRQLGMPEDSSYGLREHVRSELDFAQDIFRKNPSWMVVDVTNRAIEETASIILETLKERDERYNQFG